MSSEQKYLQKLENDVQERLWDLLVMHLQDAYIKVRKSGDNGENLVEILEKALQLLQASLNKFNKKQWYRYMIIVCNRILTYQTKRQDIKDLKKNLIEDFTKAEEDEGEKIPLNYQINEIRITYDATYLSYLMRKFIKEGLWDKALYCLVAVRLIEPDNEYTDECYKTIKDSCKCKALEDEDFGAPEDMILALDSNVLISQIFYDVGEYRIRQYNTFNLEKIGNKNKFLITDSVKDEVSKHIDYQMVGIRSFCYKNPRFKAADIEAELRKRLEKWCKRYQCEEIEVDLQMIEDIKKMYLEHLDVLEEILMDKIQGKYVSHKLRKLAHRSSLLPEDGDIRLLAETIALNGPQGGYGILSSDKDFIKFKAPISSRFNVRVFS